MGYQGKYYGKLLASEGCHLASISYIQYLKDRPAPQHYCHLLTRNKEQSLTRIWNCTVISFPCNKKNQHCWVLGVTDLPEWRCIYLGRTEDKKSWTYWLQYLRRKLCPPLISQSKNASKAQSCFPRIMIFSYSTSSATEADNRQWNH